MCKVRFTKIKFIIVVIGFFILGIISVPSLSFAESQIEAQEGDINVEVNPNNPQPYQDVTITLSSFATDLNRAIINWQTGSGTVSSGIGKTSYTFKTDGPNTYNVFNINITPVGSLNTITKTVIITPSEVNLMWESVGGYVPPFYKGKALPVGGSMIRVVAFPNTDTIKSGSGSLTYDWKKADSAVPEASGYNKNSYVFKNSPFDIVDKITVITSSVNGGYQAENTIEIPIYEPKIVLYKKSPTEGVLYNEALTKEKAMPEDEITLVAEPYFLPIKGHEKNFTYNWQINGKSINTPEKKTELTVRPNSRGGYADINVTIESVSEIFQKATSQLKLNL